VKILLIASTDSYNFSLEKLYHCFCERGHDVTLLQTEYGEEHNFAIKRLPVKRYFGSINNVQSYSIAIYENVLNESLLKKLHDAGVFCVSMFFHAFPMQYVLGSGFLYGNITFSLGNNFKKSQQENGVIQEIIPIGSPQYDDIATRPDSNEKTLLFLDQHFYPAGDDGKKQIANTLLETATENPDYQVVVKPRTLPEYQSQSKHKSRHLYDYIKELSNGVIPENLVLLEEHKNLLSLIEQSSVVATTFSTAIYPCLVINKPVIWVNGFNSRDIHYYNNNVIKSYYSQYEDTGNVVHYSMLKDSLDKAYSVKAELVNDVIYCADGKAGERIIEVLEYLNEKILINKLFLPVLDLTYDNYKQKITEYVSTNINIDDAESKCRYNLQREFNTCLDKFYRMFMTAGYIHKEIFDMLKSELRVNLGMHSVRCKSADDLVSAFHLEAIACTEKYIRQYAKKLDSNNQLSEDFKSTFLRWLYDISAYSDIISLDKSYDCIDRKLFEALIGYSSQHMLLRDLIDVLEKCRDAYYETEFPYTLFYTKTTINLIEKNLMFAYFRRLKLVLMFKVTGSYFIRNRNEIKKILMSRIYKLIPGS